MARLRARLKFKRDEAKTRAITVYRVRERRGCRRYRSGRREPRRPDFAVRVTSGQILASALSATETGLALSHPAAAGMAKATAATAATTATMTPTSAQPSPTDLASPAPKFVNAGPGGIWTRSCSGHGVLKNRFRRTSTHMHMRRMSVCIGCEQTGRDKTFLGARQGRSGIIRWRRHPGANPRWRIYAFKAAGDTPRLFRFDSANWCDDCLIFCGVIIDARATREDARCRWR
jgi:hypothetical protein